MYRLTQAANTMHIQEREYGTANTIQFGYFTSCIGVVSVVPNNKVMGVHLVTLGDRQDPPEFVVPEDITRVIQLLEAQKYDKQKTKVVGYVNYWNKLGEDPAAKTVTTSLKRLLDSLGLTLKHPRVLDQGSTTDSNGTFTARYSGGEVGISFVPTAAAQNLLKEEAKWR